MKALPILQSILKVPAVGPSIWPLHGASVQANIRLSSSYLHVSQFYTLFMALYLATKLAPAKRFFLPA